MKWFKLDRENIFSETFCKIFCEILPVLIFIFDIPHSIDFLISSSEAFGSTPNIS
jgi:hypothetical protein